MGCCSVEVTITNIVLLGGLIYGVKKLFSLYKKLKMDKILEKWDQSAPKDKLILHITPRCKTISSISPYVIKLETYLRLNKIPYEVDTKDTFGPKGKTPWITYKGIHLGDSHLIIQFLNNLLGINLNKNTPKEQLAAARACRIVLEDHFGWGSKQYRWIENPMLIPQLMKLPTLYKILLPYQATQLKKLQISVGMGRHTPSEIYQMTQDDLRTLSDILGAKKFLGGEEPCEEDCAIFGGLAQVLWALPGSTFERLIHGELSNLKQYCERMKQLCWPDWENCLDKL